MPGRLPHDLLREKLVLKEGITGPRCHSTRSFVCPPTPFGWCQRCCYSSSTPYLIWGGGVVMGSFLGEPPAASGTPFPALGGPAG